MSRVEAKKKILRVRSERRRSQRVHAVKSVVLAWNPARGQYLRVQAETEEINAHGALLRLSHPLRNGEVVELVCGPSHNWTLTNVVRSDPPVQEGWTPVAVALAVPRRDFWRS